MLRVARWLVLGCALFCSAGGLGCADDGGQLTQLVVAVDTDLRVPAEVDEVRLQVEAPSGRALDTGRTIAQAADLPLTLSLVYGSGPSAPVTVAASGLRGGEVVIEAALRTGFVKGETRLVQVLLDSACIGVSCGVVERCQSGSCVPRDIAPGSLPQWEGPPPAVGPRDGGLDAEPDADADADAASEDGSQDAANDRSEDTAGDPALDGGPGDVGVDTMDSGPADVGVDTMDSGPGDVGVDTMDSGPGDVGVDTMDSGPGDVGVDTMDSGPGDVGVDTMDSGPADVGVDTMDSGPADAGVDTMDSGPADAGVDTMDSGPGDVGVDTMDSGPADAGVDTMDSGPADAGVDTMDSGPADVGVDTMDSGPRDSGPGDVGMDTAVDAACDQEGTFCSGDRLYRCDADGGISGESCSLGCGEGPPAACRVLRPSNVAAQVDMHGLVVDDLQADSVPGHPVWTLRSDTGAIDAAMSLSDTGATIPVRSPGSEGQVRSGILFYDRFEGFSPCIGVFVFKSLNVPGNHMLVGTGRCALVILVQESAVVNGLVTVAADLAGGGPGPGPGGSPGPQTGPADGLGGGKAGAELGNDRAPGGGGGSFGGPGGQGGFAQGGSAGTLYGDTTLVPLLGGAAGGAGAADAELGGAAGRGGNGGGGLQLSAGRTLFIGPGGAIDAGGGGGGGGIAAINGSGNGGGGGGGGSGGAILLEAPDVQISGRVGAAGGAGGQGCVNGGVQWGFPGNAGYITQTLPAPGPAAAAPAGGSGGDGSDAGGAASSGGAEFVTGNAGGGGGGSGRIRINHAVSGLDVDGGLFWPDTRAGLLSFGAVMFDPS